MIRHLLLIWVIFSYPFLHTARCQDDASSFLVGIIESHNRQINDLDQFISENAKYVVDGIASDTNALAALSINFDFLNAAYSQPRITLGSVLANRNTASAEWVFSDSLGEISSGTIIIHLENKRVTSVKIYNGQIRESNGNRSLASRKRIDRKAGQENQSWWYYLRFSPGGIADPSGLYVSQPFSCDAPGTVAKKFTRENLMGPYLSRQDAGSSRQTKLNLYKSKGINFHSSEVNCGN